MSIKSTGITRPIDSLGRIVLPIELRRTLGLAERGDMMEVFVDGASIVLKKYVPEPEKQGKGKKHICDVCKKEIE
jgi:transcriptional pleiotropic regulator of transition state genes